MHTKTKLSAFVSVRLTPHELELISKLAVESDHTVSKIVRKLIVAGLQQNSYQK